MPGGGINGGQQTVGPVGFFYHLNMPDAGLFNWKIASLFFCDFFWPFHEFFEMLKK